jgi:hypothetical protein
MVFERELVVDLTLAEPAREVFIVFAPGQIGLMKTMYLPATS